MRFKTALLAALAVAATLPPVAAADDHKLVDTWVDRDYVGHRLDRVVVVGIIGLPEARRRFEDKFLTRLRERNVDGITSYSLVPQLDGVEDREALIHTLYRKGIQAAITVRLVRLDDESEEEWAKAWEKQPGSGIRIRDLVEQTLPAPKKEAKRYGVEVALWEADDWTMIWSARSDVYKRKELQDAAGPFVQRTMNDLIDEGIIP